MKFKYNILFNVYCTGALRYSCFEFDSSSLLNTSNINKSIECFITAFTPC